MWSSSCQGGWLSDLLSHWELGPLELVSRRGDQLGLATIMHAKSCLWLHIWQAQPCVMGAMKGSFTPWYLVRRKDIHLPHKCPDTKQEHTHSHKLILALRIPSSSLTHIFKELGTIFHLFPLVPQWLIAYMTHKCCKKMHTSFPVIKIANENPKPGGVYFTLQFKVFHKNDSYKMTHSIVILYICIDIHALEHTLKKRRKSGKDVMNLKNKGESMEGTVDTKRATKTQEKKDKVNDREVNF